MAGERREIHNVAFVGQAGAGKTSLIEALLHRAGVVGAPGSVEKGDTVCDYDPLEPRYGHSLKTAVAGFDRHGRHVNLIDTPGDPDLIAQSLAALPAVETVAIVVNAQAGIEPVTRRMMEEARALDLAVFVIVNKIDAEPGKLVAVLDAIREVFGRECLPFDLPAAQATRVIDCLHEEAGDSDLGDVAASHTALIEQIVEVDEGLLAGYLEGRAPSDGELHLPFERALSERHLVPVLFVSARNGAGVGELLDALADLAPAPFEAKAHGFVHGDGGSQRMEGIAPDAAGAPIAHAFKVEYDPFVGKLGVLRVHRGTLRRGQELRLDNGASLRIAHLYRLQGHDRVEIDEAGPGEICAISKVDDLHVGSILHGDPADDDLHARTPGRPMPLAGVALTPATHGDEQKVAEALHKLVEEDPGLAVEHNLATRETVLRGSGEFELKVALDRLAERYRVKVTTGKPSIPYRETVTAHAKGHYRHKKQSGGAGQFAEVYLEVEPLPRGAGFEFVNRVTGGAIPGPFIPAIEKGVRQALAGGVIAGFPLDDLRVTVTDGKDHPVDSKEVAFVIAGRRAFLDACANAATIVLEPFVDLEVTAPATNLGAITGDLATRRARIAAQDAADNGHLRLSAVVPLAEIDDYAARLKSLTGGHGSFTMRFTGYEPVPAPHQRRLMEAHKATRREE